MAKTDVEVIISAKDEASSTLKSVGGNASNMSANFKKAGTAMLATGTALGAGMLAMTKKYADAGDEVAKMSKRVQWSVESLSELRYVAEISGTDLTAFELGTRKLSGAIVDANEGLTTYTRAFDQLGVNMEDLNGKTPEEQFWVVAGALSDLEDETLKAALAQDLFGRAGTRLFPMLEEGSEGIQNLREEAHKLGLVFDEESAKESEEFVDALTNLKGGLAGIGNEIAKAVIPDLIKFADTAKNVLVYIKDWVDRNPGLVTGLKAIVAILVGGGGLLLAFSQISKAIIAVNAALVIMQSLSGPAGWAILAASAGIAAGAIIGMNQLSKMSTGSTSTGGMASGGIATKPTIAALAEKGVPEAVIPLDKMNGMGMGTNVYLTVQGSVISEDNLVTTVRQALIQIKESNVTSGL